MILKLTDCVDDAVLVNTTCVVFMQKITNCTRIVLTNTELDVKETIEEIIQQIKEGGITNGTN